MLLYENLLCIYDVIMIYLKICWFYFSFVFFSRLIQTWNIQRLIGGTSHWNKIWMSTSTVQKTWLFKKKKKKSTTDYITRNSKFKPHCQHKKVRKKVIEVGFCSAEICTWMHLKYELAFFQIYKILSWGGGGYDSEQSDQIYIKRFIEIRVKSTLLFVIIIKFSLLLLPRKISRFFYLANHSEQFVL